MSFLNIPPFWISCKLAWFLSPQLQVLSIFLLSPEKKTGEREDDVWQTLFFDFLSRRLILTQCASYQGLVDCVCVGVWFHYPPLSHFFLKNQTITDVVTEMEAPVFEGLSEQVILGASVISPVCRGGVSPLEGINLLLYQAFQLIVDADIGETRISLEILLNTIVHCGWSSLTVVEQIKWRRENKYLKKLIDFFFTVSPLTMNGELYHFHHKYIKTVTDRISKKKNPEYHVV